MKFVLLKLILPQILFLLLCFNASAAQKTSHKNINRLWQQYANSPTSNFTKGKFPYLGCFQKSAKKHELPVELLLAVGRGESNFNPVAKSKANAHGIMQILWPGTASDLGFTSISQLHDPCRNINAGAKYLKMLLKRYEGNYHLAVAAYNYGPGNIKLKKEPPAGAKWYSSYIYDHLSYILTLADSANPVDYSTLKNFQLQKFSRPYQAKGYVESLRRSVPNMQFDWFRDEEQADLGRNNIYFAVLVSSDEKTLKRALARLREKGLIR